MVFLQTDRLILRNYTMDDVSAVHAYFSSEEDGTEYSTDFDFSPRFWHRGYAQEAAREVVRHLAEELQVKEIRGDCDERNTASSKLLERLGFALTETVDDAYKEDADRKPVMIRSRDYKLTV